jgi:hypothetical protein
MEQVIPEYHQASIKKLVDRNNRAQRKLEQAKWDAETARRNLFSAVWKVLDLPMHTEGQIGTGADGEVVFIPEGDGKDEGQESGSLPES